MDSWKQSTENKGDGSLLKSGEPRTELGAKEHRENRESPLFCPELSSLLSVQQGLAIAMSGMRIIDKVDSQIQWATLGGRRGDPGLPQMYVSTDSFTWCHSVRTSKYSLDSLPHTVSIFVPKVKWTHQLFVV